MITAHATQALSHVASPVSPCRAAEREQGLETGKDQLRKEATLQVWHAISQEPEDHEGYSTSATQSSHGKTTSPNTGRVVLLQAAIN